MAAKGGGGIFPEGYFSDGAGSGIPLAAGATPRGKRHRASGGVTNGSKRGTRRNGKSTDATPPKARGRTR